MRNAWRKSIWPNYAGCDLEDHPTVSDDWRTVEDALNAASEGASEPLYSQVESAKAALFRLGSAAVS